MTNFRPKFITKSSLSLIFGLAITLIATAAGFSRANAWGPERTTYTNKSPAPYATFNSITDNVAVGDERNFVRIREAGTSDTFVDELQVVPGHEYEVYIYYHNNAASNTNASGIGMATNARVSSAYPAVVNASERGMVSGIISWSYVTPEDPNNAKTGTVWDEAYVTSSVDGVVLKYKTGTAVIHNDGATNGTILPSSLFTEGGTPLGYNQLIGNLPGCAEYSGHITYTLVAENPGSELSKQVSVDGENWFEGVTVKPGDFVTYKVAFKNTGNTNFTNLIFTDNHDADLILRPGSTKIYDYKNVDGYAIDDIIDISGFNTGDILAGGLVQATYQMQVRNDESLCGKTLVNTMIADFNSTEQKTDAATVKVTCDEPTEEDCSTNPSLPGCNVTPPQEENCDTNPNLPGCNLPSSIVQTGPLEIAMAVLVALGIGGAGFYFWRTKHALKTVESAVVSDAGGSVTDTSVGSTSSDSVSSDSMTSNSATLAPSSTATSDSSTTVASATSHAAKPTTPASFSEPAAGPIKTPTEPTMINPTPAPQEPDSAKEPIIESESDSIISASRPDSAPIPGSDSPASMPDSSNAISDSESASSVSRGAPKSSDLMGTLASQETPMPQDSPMPQESAPQEPSAPQSSIESANPVTPDSFDDEK